MKYLSLTVILGFAMAFSSVAQTVDYKSRIQLINKNIYDKLHVHSQTEAVAKAIKDRLI